MSGADVIGAGRKTIRDEVSRSIRKDLIVPVASRVVDSHPDVRDTHAVDVFDRPRDAAAEVEREVDVGLSCTERDRNLIGRSAASAIYPAFVVVVSLVLISEGVRGNDVNVARHSTAVADVIPVLVRGRS